MEAESTYETSVNFYQTTRRNIPEDSHLHKKKSVRIAGLRDGIRKLDIQNAKQE
jgi:hypothetical protein